MIGHECLHAIKNNKTIIKNMAAVKLDLSKAYDRVEWAFLKEIMCRLGFNERWISLVHNRISTAQFSVIINKEMKGSFHSSRGLRQGDPLSPYLFLLIAEGLSSLISGANMEGRLSSISCSLEGPSISHLLFADDSLVFCKADEREMIHLKRLLLSYERASGESVNYEKSAMVFTKNVTPHRSSFLSSILGVKCVVDLGNYLGVPSSFSRSKTKDFSFIMNKVGKAL